MTPKPRPPHEIHPAPTSIGIYEGQGSAKPQPIFPSPMVRKPPRRGGLIARLRAALKREGGT